MFSPKFPFQKQYDKMDCGPACLTMIMNYHGKQIDIDIVRQKCQITQQGVNLSTLESAAESFHLNALSVQITPEQLYNEAPLPCIIHWKSKHFIIVYKVTSKYVHIADPAFGTTKLTRKVFVNNWIQEGYNSGICILLEPTNEFNNLNESEKKTKGFNLIFKYLVPYKPQFWQITAGLLVTSMINIALPFLTQRVVDYGINYGDVNFIYLILGAQLFFFIVLTALESIRNWIVLHIISRVNYRLISDYLYKLFQLPVSFFSTKQKGDLMQRVHDHSKIDEFLASHSLVSIFSLVNILVFGAILFSFDTMISLVFLIGTILYFLWIIAFSKKREKIDHEIFSAFGEHQNILMGILDNMHEIILNGSQARRRKQWQDYQRKVFRLNIRNLSIMENQSNGSLFINESKNILVIFLAALAVIKGELTLGSMLAIQYIVAQVSFPIQNISTFIIKFQDADLALKRLAEVHNTENDKQDGITELNGDLRISFKNLGFSFSDITPMVLANISIDLKPNTITAIVGPSGSGKSTLIKLLLKYHLPRNGAILLNGINLNAYNNEWWRSQLAVVMQDGVIFDDTIERNITESRSNQLPDNEAIYRSLKLANLLDLTDNLPLGIKTHVGVGGISLSGGERQRLLIARAVYKAAPILILDEATSALDSENENLIMNNLKDFYNDKVVIIIAHRLSTIRDADQIIVLDKSNVAEIGTHRTLMEKDGRYSQLINNQI